MPDSVKGCVSCEIISGRRKEPGGTLYQDAYWHVGSVLEPVVWRGFTIVKLRRHCEHLAALTPEESAGLGPVLRAVCQALTDVLQPEKVYVCSFGEGVRHIHFWVLPRPAGMRPGMHSALFNLDLRLGLTRLLGVKRWLVPPAEIEADSGLLRARMSELLGPR